MNETHGTFYRYIRRVVYSYFALSHAYHVRGFGLVNLL